MFQHFPRSAVSLSLKMLTRALESFLNSDSLSGLFRGAQQPSVFASLYQRVTAS